MGHLGRRHTAQLAIDGWQMDYPDPSNFIEPNFHSRSIQEEQSSNHAFYRNAEVDALTAQGRAEPSLTPAEVAARPPPHR